MRGPEVRNRCFGDANTDSKRYQLGGSCQEHRRRGAKSRVKARREPRVTPWGAGPRHPSGLAGAVAHAWIRAPVVAPAKVDRVDPIVQAAARGGRGTRAVSPCAGADIDNPTCAPATLGWPETAVASGPRALGTASPVCHDEVRSTGVPHEPVRSRCREARQGRHADGASVHVPSFQLTEGQPPPIAANGGLSWMAFDRDGGAGTAAATEAALRQVAEGEVQAVIDRLENAPSGPVETRWGVGFRTWEERSAHDAGSPVYWRRRGPYPLRYPNRRPDRFSRTRPGSPNGSRSLPVD